MRVYVGLWGERLRSFSQAEYCFFVFQVYGSSKSAANNLRDLTNDWGLMRVNDRFQDGEIQGRFAIMSFFSISRLGQICFSEAFAVKILVCFKDSVNFCNSLLAKICCS